jgi:hypothetical protein
VGQILFAALALFGAVFLRHKLYIPQAGDPITRPMYDSLLEATKMALTILIPLFAAQFLVCAWLTAKCKRLLKDL